VLRAEPASRRKGLIATVAAGLLVVGLAVTGTHVASAGTSPLAANALAPSAGCGKAPGLSSGKQTIQSGGKNRSYILKVPDSYDSNFPHRLAFGYHWVGGTADQVAGGGTDGASWAYYGMQSQAGNSTIFVAPQGLNNGWGNSGGEDVRFTDDMIKQIEGALCVDTTQLFSVGFSYGAAMTYALACARPTVFRAVAVIAVGQLSGCDGGTQPIAYMGIHGVSDGTLSISGGRSMRDRFVTNNGCTRQNPPEPAVGSHTHILTQYSGCRAGYPVVWAAFDGGHQQGPVDGCASCESGARSWVKPEVWKFFSQFGSTSPTSPGPSSPGPSSPGPSSPGPSSPGPSSPGPSSPGPVTSSPSTGGPCRVAAKVNEWNSGLTEEITITNTGASAINGWSLTFSLPGGQSITSGWNASYSPASGSVTARNASYNGSLAPNASVSIGFQANHTGNSAAPTAFTLNGAACTVA
jgi:poly(3-hydroxybutyrate) depolymerase